MAAPAIALRFRDPALGIDTIAEHQAIIREEGAVWWGWWKKEFEEDHSSFLDSLSAQAPVDILIVDRSTKRMFLSQTRQWSKVISSDNQKQIPGYYRTDISRVFGWFLLSQIEPIEYDESIAREFGDDTLIVLNASHGPAKKAVSQVSGQNKSCVLHLSDLHFGEDYDFLPQGTAPAIGEYRKTLTECLTSDLKRLDLAGDVAAVIVTGDFTTRGNWNNVVRPQILREFESLRAALGLTPVQIIAVPGNHDIVRYPGGEPIDIAKLAVESQTGYQHEREFRTFLEELTGRSWRETLNYVQRVALRDSDLLICVLNSCTISATNWTEYGFVGDSGVAAIRRVASENIGRATYKFMTLHHHLLPVARVEEPNSKGVTLSLDATQLLDEAQQANIHVILHGHQHQPRIARYQTIPFNGRAAAQPLSVVSNGSVGSKTRPGSERNAYCVFQLSGEKARLCMRELRSDGVEAKSLFDDDLGIKPQTP